jgi:hypothetical protein
MWGTGQAMGYIYMGVVYRSHALLKAECRLLIRAPSVTHSDSFSIIMTGRQIPNPEAIAKDTQAAERLIRQITGMEQLEFDRWDYLVSHKSASVHPYKVVPATEPFDAGRKSGWLKSSVEAASSSPAMLLMPTRQRAVKA